MQRNIIESIKRHVTFTGQALREASAPLISEIKNTLHEMPNHSMKAQFGDLLSTGRTVIALIFLFVVGVTLSLFVGGVLQNGLGASSTTANTGINNLLTALNTQINNNGGTVFLLLLIAIPIIIVIGFFLYFVKKTDG